MSTRRGGVLRAAVISIVLAITSSGAFAGEDLPSTPYHAPLAGPERTGRDTATIRSLAPEMAAVPAGVLGTIGLNFQGSELNVDSGFIPPDTMGAVGPNHIVQMINGRFDVYDKATGAQVFTRSLDGFWTNVVGLTIPPSGDPTDPNFTFDPRIVYDSATGRWFAASIDGDFGAGNNFFVARSDTNDPTGTWQGVRFAADTLGGPEFHDYETLAVDAVGLYMCTQDFGGGGNESCYSIPKADLLLSPPSVANLTRFEATPAGLPAVTGSLQPALNVGPSVGRTPLLGANGGVLRRSDILGGGGAGATLGAVRGIVGDPGHATPPAARQPHPFDATVTIENVAPRFVSNVIQVGTSLWAVHAVLGTSGNSALRWYEIDEATDTVLQTGLIEVAGQDFHEPSIAVNQLGNAVIGYTCSGPTLSPSSCASLGETVAGVMTFQPPIILAGGAGHYYRDFASPPDAERNRWGDYSATVVDPVDPCTFWTLQEFVAVSATGDVGPDPRAEGGAWGIQITELTFNACAQADLTISKSDSPDPVAAGTNLAYTLNVQNSGPSRAHDVVVTDTLPASVTFVSAAGTNWSCAAVAGTVTCTWQGGNPVGSLANGQAATPITITVAVPANHAAGLISNTASVTSATPDPIAANNTAVQSTEVIVVADLEIVSFVVLNPPAEVMVGQDVVVTLRKQVRNNGPSGPVDATLTLTATPPADSTVNPAVQVIAVAALDVDELRTVDEQVTIRCGAASQHAFKFDNEISFTGGTDPDLSNNTKSVTLQVECVVPVLINIKPGGGNPVNPSHGTVPVAVLTTAAGEGGTPVAFDATQILPLTVRFGPRDVVLAETGGAFEQHDRGHIEDAFELDEVTKDGDLDMVLHFRAAESGIQVGDTEACVKGQFVNATGTHKFFGCDVIRTVPR